MHDSLINNKNLPHSFAELCASSTVKPKPNGLYHDDGAGAKAEKIVQIMEELLTISNILGHSV